MRYQIFFLIPKNKYIVRPLKKYQRRSGSLVYYTKRSADAKAKQLNTHERKI